MIPPRKWDAVVWLTKITKTNQEIIEEAIALTDATTAAATDWLRTLVEVSIYSVCLDAPRQWGSRKVPSLDVKKVKMLKK